MSRASPVSFGDEIIKTSSISAQSSDMSSGRCAHQAPVASSPVPPPGFGIDLGARNNATSSLPKRKEVVIPHWLVTSNPDLVKSK